MGQKQLCLDGSRKKKKTPKRPQRQLTPPGDNEEPGLSHKGKTIGNFTAANMEACIAEIKRYHKWMKDLGLPKMEKSMNQIARNHGLSPSMVNKRMTGKVTGMGSQLGGARKGRILTAGRSMFQATWLPSLPLVLET